MQNSLRKLLTIYFKYDNIYLKERDGGLNQNIKVREEIQKTMKRNVQYFNFRVIDGEIKSVEIRTFDNFITSENCQKLMSVDEELARDLMPYETEAIEDSLFIPNKEIDVIYTSEHDDHFRSSVHCDGTVVYNRDDTHYDLVDIDFIKKYETSRLSEIANLVNKNCNIEVNIMKRRVQTLELVWDNEKGKMYHHCERADIIIDNNGRLSLSEFRPTNTRNIFTF